MWVYMDRFILTADLLTNIPDIDAQHRKLFDLVNQVVDPSTVDQGTGYFLTLLYFLTGYVTYHFAAEEAVMRESGYPRYELHQHWHDAFRAEVGELVVASKSKGVSRALKLNVSFTVENWLLAHIRVADRQLAEYLAVQSRGQATALPDVLTLQRAGAIPRDYVEPAIEDKPTR